MIEVAAHTAPPTACDVFVLGGAQLLDRWFDTDEGQRHAGAGLLDLTTAPGPGPGIGEVTASCTEPGLDVLTGFENHRGLTTLAPELAPPGGVTSGTGNGDGTDGVLTDTVVGTYLHGPVLTRKPRPRRLHPAPGHRRPGLPPLDLPDQQPARRWHLATAGRHRH